MSSIFLPAFLRRIDFSNIKFNEIVHRGYFPGARTVSGTPRTSDFYDLIGTYVLADLVKLGFSARQAGKMAAAFMDVMKRRAAEKKGAPLVIRMRPRRDEIEIVEIEDLAPITEQAGPSVWIDFMVAPTVIKVRDLFEQCMAELEAMVDNRPEAP